MTPRRVDQALLLARTTRNLRASQVVHRARLRAQRWPPSRPVGAQLLASLPLKHPTVQGWPSSFTPLDLQAGDGFPTPEQNALGRFTFLNDERHLGSPPDWVASGSSRLWAYHLHYMEWAWAFATNPDPDWARAAFGALWRSWAAAAPFGQGDPWSPYVASLRAWALCGTYAALSEGSEVQPAIDASLALHARFLRWHVEHDVGGNHLVKNLKALAGLALFLGDDRLLAMATGELRRQLGVQVLSDGGHYERSPSYHCQVLGDFVDIAGLLAAGGRPPVPGLAEAIESMRTWLGLMLMPDGDVPLFNDCVLVGPSRLALLRPGPPAAERLTVLPASGYVVVRPHERLHLVADVGDPCPPDLPAHAQADCLTFELAADGRRVVVDSGTSTYAPGTQRRHERSTAAHNTVVVDRADQTEVWGTFRAARLARGRLERVDDDGRTITVVASHDGYRRLPGKPVHQRTWRVGEHVEITDQITGGGEHGIESHIHFAAPGIGKAVWSGPANLGVSERPASYATEFGVTHDGHRSSATWHGELPVTVGVELHLDDAVNQSSARTIDDGQSTKDLP
jgi:uncharacterized heparinase superfamily protein